MQRNINLPSEAKRQASFRGKKAMATEFLDLKNIDLMDFYKVRTTNNSPEPTRRETAETMGEMIEF